MFRVSNQVFAALLISLMAGFGCGGNSNSTPPPPTPLVQLNVSVTGSGTVSSSPPGISCPSTCVASFNQGTSVTLTTAAGSGYNFAGFGGACNGASCQLVLGSTQSISANFTAASAQVTVAITGNGTVTSTPAGINCPSTCTASFAGGTNVSLSATPGSGYSFSAFTGACSGSSCQLALSNGQSASVGATFTQNHNITSIQHVIVMLQENRSFDHYFGHLPAYWQAHGFPQASNGTTLDGEPSTASNVDPKGSTVNAYNIQSACTENPSPSSNESHVDR
ncbi:MAG: hypothetical protein JO356_06325, partial [Acidobacteria bacterium]|nr:hypothetical protein [Acidobacteriota bacterium]